MERTGREQIAVIDFGGQTSHLICRRLRDSRIYSEVFPSQTPILDSFRERGLDPDTVRGVIFSGSPSSVSDPGAPSPHRQILQLFGRVPFLGICYGLHWLAEHLGGRVRPLARKEYGPNRVYLEEPARAHPLLRDVPADFLSWMSHSDSLDEVPPQFSVLGRSEQGLPALLALEETAGSDPAFRAAVEALTGADCPGRLELFGVQYHPEISHCEGGTQLLENFAFGLCKMSPNWELTEWRAEKIEEIRQTAGSSRVVSLVSGGVDSSVTAVLLLRALDPDQVYLMYFDTGLMRKAETEKVLRQLESLGARHLYRVDAQRAFLDALAGVCDPEEKRQIIGNLFITIQNERIESLPGSGEPYFLAQGTLYTDMIESGLGVGDSAALIKSHHNVGTPLVRKMRTEGRLIEPLNSLYKDEVRLLGEQLGLPKTMTRRQPFPGPGFAIRVLGEVTEAKLALLREIDDLYLNTLREMELYGEIWQAFAVLLPVESVGIVGDARCYGPVVALRAIVSKDGMSAEVYPFTPGQLQILSTKISNAFPEISRVVYDISAKPPATIEWE